jgi:hypothetical protein
MLINEITSSEDQLNLLKLISNCTWSAIQQQNTDAVNQAKKIKPKKGRPKQVKLKVPPPPPPKPLPSNALDLSSQEQMKKVKQMFDKLKPKEVDPLASKNSSQ